MTIKHELPLASHLNSRVKNLPKINWVVWQDG